MEILLSSPAFWLAAVMAGVMGFAIQRGATCTVAAMDELVNARRAHRLVGLVEASLWVLGGLLIAQSLGLLAKMPAGYAIGPMTVLGGVLLGMGAYVNGACVFGAIARLGSGELAFAVTPLGFYLGCLTVGAIFSPVAPVESTVGSPVLQASMWVALPFAALMLLRIVRTLLRSEDDARAPIVQRLREIFTARIWSPHAATAVIGITFLLMLLLVGAWAYTDVLAELARGMAESLVARGALAAALFLGAVVGGATAGRLRGACVTGAQVAKCFAGGVLMGWGSLLIPGGNDGLILVGMPLLWPYAWVAFATMCVSIAAAMLIASAVVGGRSGDVDATIT